MPVGREPNLLSPIACSRWITVGVVRLLLCLGALLQPLAGQSASVPAPLTLAIHPYLPDAEILFRYTPLADYLSEALANRVIVRIGRNYADHLTHIGTGQVDLALLGPASYVKLTGSRGPMPLLARLEIHKKPVFRGAIVTRTNNRITDLASLTGRRFAFGDPSSTMSHLVPRYMLMRAGVQLVDLDNYDYLGSHVNVALGVLSGDYDAGAMKEEIFREYQARGLRLLAWTPYLSEHLFVARQGMPEEIIEALRHAMYSLDESKTGRDILRGMKAGATGLRPVSDADYDDLRRILAASPKAAP